MAECFECWNEEILAAAAVLGDVCVFILHTLARTWQRVAWGRMIGSLAVTGMFWPPHTPHSQPRRALMRFPRVWREPRASLLVARSGSHLYETALCKPGF
jgi:hypothetical protein